MPKVRIVWNYPGFNELRRSADVQQALHDAGEAIAEAAGGGPDFISEDSVNGSRARTVVLTATPKGMALEATRRSLTKAIDAGRS